MSLSGSKKPRRFRKGSETTRGGFSKSERGPKRGRIQNWMLPPPLGGKRRSPNHSQGRRKNELVRGDRERRWGRLKTTIVATLKTLLKPGKKAYCRTLKGRWMGGKKKKRTMVGPGVTAVKGDQMSELSRGEQAQTKSKRELSPRSERRSTTQKETKTVLDLTNANSKEEGQPWTTKTPPTCWTKQSAGS